MERFYSGDRYNHDDNENRDARKNRPLRNITSIYGKSTDQPASSAQEPSNYGEELAQSWWNSLFNGQSDTHGYGSYEHEGGYVDHAEREIVGSQAESSWAGLLWRWLPKRQSDTPEHGSYEHEGRYTAVRQSPDPSEQRSSQEDTGTSLSDDYCIDHNQEHIYNTHQHDITDHDIPSSSSYDSAVKTLNQIGTIEDVIQYKKAELQVFFSADKTERAFAEAKAATIAYLERWKNKNDDIYHFARTMLKNTGMGQDDLLDTFSQVNEKLKSLSKKHQKEYTEQEMDTAQGLFWWTKTFRKCFNIRKGQVEDWVQAGLKQQLGIEFEDFRKSYRYLRKLIEDSSPESDEKLVVTNAKFKYIHELLKEGIPVADIPKSICGRKVTNVDGKGYNCLIRALLKGAHPKWEDEFIEDIVGDMRQHLIDKELAKEGEMLDLNREEGQYLINNMKTANLIESDRDLLIYQYHKKKIHCLLPNITFNKSPYAVLLDYDGEHFYAIELPE